MKNNKLLAFGGIFLIIFVLSLISLFPVVDSSTNLTGYATYDSGNNIIYECGTITEPGTYYLNQSIGLTGLFKETPPCLTISTYDVVLEGQQFTISGNNAGVGLLISGQYNISVNDLDFTNFSSALTLSRSDLIFLNNLSVVNSSLAMDFSFSSDNTISNVVIEDVNSGIELSASNNNIFSNVSVTNSDSQSIKLSELSSQNKLINFQSIHPGSVSIVDTTGVFGTNYFWYESGDVLINWTADSFLQDISLTNDLNLKSTITLNTNLVRMRSIDFTQLANLTVNISLKNSPATGLTNPQIFKDGVVCEDCVAYTDLTAETVIFEASGLGEYMLSEPSALEVTVIDDSQSLDLSSSPVGEWLMPGRTLDQSYTQPQTMNVASLQEDWNITLGAKSKYLVADDSKILFTQGDFLFAYTYSGEKLWEYDFSKRYLTSPVMDTLGAVYIRSADTLVKIDGGVKQWEYILGKSPYYLSFAPVVDAVYSKGTLYSSAESVSTVDGLAYYKNGVNTQTGSSFYSTTLIDTFALEPVVFASLPRKITYVNATHQQKNSSYIALSTLGTILLDGSSMVALPGYSYHQTPSSILPKQQLICHEENQRYVCDNQLGFVSFDEGIEVLYLDGDQLKSSILPSSYVRPSTNNQYLEDDVPVEVDGYFLSDNSLVAGTNFTYYYVPTSSSGSNGMYILRGLTNQTGDFINLQVSSKLSLDYVPSDEPILLNEDMLLYPSETKLVGVDAATASLVFEYDCGSLISSVIVANNHVLVLTANNLFSFSEEEILIEEPEVIEESSTQEISVDVSFMAGCDTQDSVVVVASEGLIIEGASVSFTSENISVSGTTNSQGMFSIRLPQDVYTLEISVPEFDDFSQTVTVGVCEDAYTPEELEELIDSILNSFIEQAGGNSGTTNYLVPYIPQRSIRFSSPSKTVVLNATVNESATTAEDGPVLFFNSGKAFSFFMLILVLLLIIITLYVRHKVHALRQQQGKLE